MLLPVLIANLIGNAKMLNVNRFLIGSNELSLSIWTYLLLCRTSLAHNDYDKKHYCAQTTNKKYENRYSTRNQSLVFLPKFWHVFKHNDLIHAFAINNNTVRSQKFTSCYFQFKLDWGKSSRVICSTKYDKFFIWNFFLL